MDVVMDQTTFPGFEPVFPKPAHASPVLKWAGGKRWIVPILSTGVYRRLAPSGGRYVEPFLGGGALALDLGLPGMVLGDACVPLIQSYLSIRDFPQKVAWALSAFATAGVDEATYYAVRDMIPADDVEAAARFIYLNKLGFNGLYRENKSGKFNVPYGGQKYRESSVLRKGRDAVETLFPSKGRLEAVAHAFATSEIAAQDFRVTIDRARGGDIVFADPPYAGTFAAYTADGFSLDDQIDLAASLQAATERGATFVMTNSDTPEIRELYEWCDVMATAEIRAINSDGAGRGRQGCVIATNRTEILG